MRPLSLPHVHPSLSSLAVPKRNAESLRFPVTVDTLYVCWSGSTVTILCSNSVTIDNPFPLNQTRQPFLLNHNRRFFSFNHNYFSSRRRLQKRMDNKNLWTIWTILNKSIYKTDDISKYPNFDILPKNTSENVQPPVIQQLIQPQHSVNQYQQINQTYLHIYQWTLPRILLIQSDLSPKTEIHFGKINLISGAFLSKRISTYHSFVSTVFELSCQQPQFTDSKWCRST